MYQMISHTQAYCKKCCGSESVQLGLTPSTICPYCKTSGRVITDVIFNCQHQYGIGVVVGRGETKHTCVKCNHTTTMFSDD